MSQQQKPKESAAAKTRKQKKEKANVRETVYVKVLFDSNFKLDAKMVR
jgi:hypothetical protein